MAVVESTQSFVQEGKKSKSKLSQDRIDRLEDIGFNWNLDEAFEKRCREL